jgi:hypothetical protein
MAMRSQNADEKQDDDDEMAVDAMLVSVVHLTMVLLFFLGLHCNWVCSGRWLGASVTCLRRVVF